jgi:hypothetical protein
MLAESIGLSVILGFLANEFLGVSAGGLVSPGYLAFYLDQPIRLAPPWSCRAAIYGTVRLLQRFMIIYGNTKIPGHDAAPPDRTWRVRTAALPVRPDRQVLRTIGYIIPGLIANDMLRQGPIKTSFLSCSSPRWCGSS